jgi:hypothetical protein
VLIAQRALKSPGRCTLWRHAPPAEQLANHSQVAVNAEADVERLRQATSSSQAAAQERREVLFKPRNGYAADTITKDRRFRAAAMFRARGLLRTKYAQDALRGMQCAIPQRVDMMTSEQREAWKAPAAWRRD